MKSLQQVVIYGAGGFAREVRELLRDVVDGGERWDVLGFLDDAMPVGRVLNDLPILGGEEWLRSQPNPPHVVIGVGSPAAKRRIAGRIKDVVPGFPVIVHPSVVRSRNVSLGIGTVVAAGNVLTTNIAIAEFVTVNISCTIGHDVTIASYATVLPGVNISGNVAVGEGVDVGTGSCIIQGVEIGEWSIVGAGAVVARPIPPNCTAVGLPAKPIKFRSAGWHLE